MSSAVEVAVASMAAQHGRFLDEMAGELVGLLKAENLRLARELAQLKDSAMMGLLPKPPIPPVPMRLSRKQASPRPAIEVDELEAAVATPSFAEGSPGSPVVQAAAPQREDEPTASRREAEEAPPPLRQRAAAPEASPPALGTLLLPGELDDEEWRELAAFPSPKGLGALKPTIAALSPKKTVQLPMADSDYSAVPVEERLLALREVHRKEGPAASEAVVDGVLVGSVASHLQTVRMSRSMIMKAHAAMNPQRRVREIRRLGYLILGSDDDKRLSQVTPDILYSALTRRNEDIDVSRDAVEELVESFAAIERDVLTGTDRDPAVDKVSIASLVELIWMRDINDHLPKSLRKDAGVVLDALRTPTPEELAHEVTRLSFAAAGLDTGGRVAKSLTFSGLMNWMVSGVVILNMIVMGVSVDHNPEGVHWMVVEMICTAFYLFELCFWLHALGPKRYFTGELATWNIADMTITFIAVLQVILEVVTRIDPHLINENSQLASATKATIMLRALRTVRVIRLVKMVRSPILRDLANMLVGFVIGLPSLFWVLFMLCLILSLFGLFSRMMFGPSSFRPVDYWTSQCGSGDDIVDFSDPLCPVHFVYGEEFFGSVGKSMFTCFRFMLGDYSTRGGKSIVVAFSQEYGTQFDVVFVAWMIIVIFGIFNIITAIFVDATTAGLKHNETKRKHLLQYERAYVKEKLVAVLQRIKVLQEKEAAMALSPTASRKNKITEDQFVDLCKDEQVMMLLSDLDVSVMNLSSIFSAFDADDTGSLTLEELAEGIMRLRGEPQKTDIIGCWVSARLLHDKVDALSKIIETKVGGLEAPTMVPKEAKRLRALS